MRTLIWAYLGTRDPHDPRVRELSLTPHVTAACPSVFISVGNADPLAPQSVAFAEALRAKGSKSMLFSSRRIMIRCWSTNIRCCFRLTQAALRSIV
jgi:acetyl esterase/lipase